MATELDLLFWGAHYFTHLQIPIQSHHHPMNYNAFACYCMTSTFASSLFPEHNSRDHFSILIGPEPLAESQNQHTSFLHGFHSHFQHARVIVQILSQSTQLDSILTGHSTHICEINEINISLFLWNLSLSLLEGKEPTKSGV